MPLYRSRDHYCLPLHCYTPQHHRCLRWLSDIIPASATAPIIAINRLWLRVEVLLIVAYYTQVSLCSESAKKVLYLLGLSLAYYIKSLLGGGSLFFTLYRLPFLILCLYYTPSIKINQ